MPHARDQAVEAQRQDDFHWMVGLGRPGRLHDHTQAAHGLTLYPNALVDVEPRPVLFDRPLDHGKLAGRQRDLDRFGAQPLAGQFEGQLGIVTRYGVSSMEAQGRRFEWHFLYETGHRFVR